MSRIAKLAGLLIATASTFVGCLQEHALDPVATERAAEAAIPDSGFVPYPILHSYSVLEIAPVLGNEGQYLPGWNGSVADLIAADAYALCTLTSPYWSADFGTTVLKHYPGRGNDKYLNYLLAKIGETVCQNQPNPDLAEVQWHYLRTNRDCNLDPRSGELSRIDGFQRNSSGYASMFTSEDPGVWGLNGPLEILQAAREMAMREVAYADLNLCMAQYMRDKVNSGQSLFTSSSDLTEMLGVIRERAQLASLHYAFLAKVASYEQPSGSEPTTLVSATNDWLILLRHWLREVAPEPDLARIGEDAATAVRLTIQSTNDLATVLQRSAGQRPIGAGGLSRAERDWGLGQPRIRLMNLLYGGDPIGTTDGLQVGGRGWGGTDRHNGAPPFVSADMSDSRIGTLLGLARAADAFHLKITVAQGVGGFDPVASAERLYQSVEVMLRVQRCELQTPEAECDPSDLRAELPPLDEFTDYLLWQKHSVEPGVARRLTDALGQAFRELVRTFPEPGRDGMLHLTGEHSTVTIEGAEWLHIARDFGMVPLAGHELAQDYARLVYLPERIVLEADPYDQGFSMHGGSGSSYAWEKLRELGAVPALAFIREALAEGGLVQGSRARFFESAGVVLPEIEREIGPRSVIVRPVLEEQIVPCPADAYTIPGADCQNLSHASDQYRVRSTTRGDDPLVELTLAPRSRQVNTVAIDADTVGYDEVTRADLDDYPTSAGVVEPLGGYAAGYEQRAFSFDDGGTSTRLLLRGDSGGTNESIYMVLGDSWMNAGDSLQVSSGGELNFLGERTMQTLAHDWSQPAQDAFGFPADWVPPADASLVGGSPGEQSYTYYLRVARQAAEEATAAVQVAIDNLILETEQQVDLDAAEQRAETIAGIERAAICGTSERCTDLYIVQGAVWLPVLGDCTTNDLGEPLGSDAQAHCEAAMAARDELLPKGLRVTDEAYAAFRAGTPAFADYAGSELQGVLIRQWNAMTTLALVDAAFLSQARSLATEFVAADAGLEAARAEKVAAVEDVNDAIAALDAQALGIQGELDELAAEESSYLEMYNLAEARMERECSDAAMIFAQDAGYSYADAKGVRVNRAEEEWTIKSYASKSWSPGPAIAQQNACIEASIQFSAMLSTRKDPETGAVLPSSHDARLASISSRRAALLARTELTELEKETMVLRIAAAEAACDAATATASASRQARWAQLVASLSEFQAAVAAVVASQSEFDILAHRLEGVSAEEALEKDLANKEAEARFGIQRKFRSYDMWRARALLESARRLAVAARRAVESHFVVDLSELEATQAFVESPALWADEVYGSDLDAPSVVGLSAAPKIEEAVYPNKLIDYVENLERFVQGYTISNPTSLAEPDTEVLSLPGPDVREQLPAATAEAQQLEVVSATSAGWSFQCPASGAWLSNPGIGEHPLANSVARLCGSGDDRTPPARARYAFTLDPWGRLGGGIAFDPLEQRHNVRWSRLAVNLVGTGIRDCERAPDPLVCHSEPFLRYDLKHVGPAWTTNYAEEWRAFNLPTALVEDGKALAAEEWLDPLTNSWNTPLVSNAGRSELFGRSVGGSYELELELGPEVQLKRIERVQVLVETRYWVRQE